MTHNSSQNKSQQFGFMNLKQTVLQAGNKLRYRFVKKSLLLGLTATLLIVAASCVNIFDGPPFGDAVLDVGVVSLPPKLRPQVDYDAFKSYLEEKLQERYGKVVKVEMETLPIEAIQEIPEKIKSKEWDIAFTLNPIYSIVAEENEYELIARMGRQFVPFFDVAFFVPKNSPIRGVDDLNSNTTIAVGHRAAAPFFIMPIYDLYGKTVRLDRGNLPPQIIKKVASGEADVGVGLYAQIKKDSRFRVIGQSRLIPIAGVFLSPEIKEKEEGDFIKKLLLDAPEEIQRKGNYGIKGDINYKEFGKIASRVNEILDCVDLTLNPVSLYCNSDKKTSPTPKPSIIQGKVNGYELESDIIRLKLQGDNRKAYTVILPKTILNQIPNTPEPTDLSGKTIRVTNVEPTSKSGGIEQLQINAPEQLKIFSN